MKIVTDFVLCNREVVFRKHYFLKINCYAFVGNHTKNKNQSNKHSLQVTITIAEIFDEILNYLITSSMMKNIQILEYNYVKNLWKSDSVLLPKVRNYSSVLLSRKRSHHL